MVPEAGQGMCWTGYSQCDITFSWRENQLMFFVEKLDGYYINHKSGLEIQSICIVGYYFKVSGLLNDTLAHEKIGG